jgi:uncharacterized protein (TIGR02594 family)
MVSGMAASLVALCSITPAHARRMPPGDRWDVSGGQAEPGQNYARDIGGEPQERAARRHRRAVEPRHVERSHRHTERSERHARQVRRSGIRHQAAGVAYAVEPGDVEPVGGIDRRRAGTRSEGAIGGDGLDGRYGRSEQSYATGGFDFGGVVAEARRWLGGNPTNRRSLWCGAFMNFVLQRTGHQGTGSDLARSFASLGHRVPGPQVGAIAVMARRGGGHVGVVSGIDARGNPIIISGNHGRRVAESTYQRGRVYAYVMP